MKASWDGVFLVRHGQTEWNLRRRSQGRLDSALTAEGVAQARRHAATLRPYAGLTKEEMRERDPEHWRRRAIDKYRWVFPGGESYADADVRAGHALARIGGFPVRRPLVVAHEMVGRMLLRHLLGLDPDDALTYTHPHDVVYAVDPAARTTQRLR